MNRQTAVSPSMKSVGWENRVLEIEFQDGTVRHYDDVSYAEYCGFLGRASLGASFMELLKRHPEEN